VHARQGSSCDGVQNGNKQQLARMECLTSSAMSPDCSSSGSESSLTAPNTPTSGSPDYLAQLLKDRKQMQAFSNVFIHLGRILEDGEYTLHMQVRLFISSFIDQFYY